jgi:hypothetical protein
MKAQKKSALLEGVTTRLPCPRCGSLLGAVERFMRGGTLCGGASLIYWRCGACNVLFSHLTPGHLTEATHVRGEDTTTDRQCEAGS